MLLFNEVQVKVNRKRNKTNVWLAILFINLSGIKNITY